MAQNDPQAAGLHRNANAVNPIKLPALRGILIGGSLKEISGLISDKFFLFHLNG